MNNLQAAFILMNQKEAMPGWVKSERYDYCEAKGLRALIHYYLHR